MTGINPTFPLHHSSAVVGVFRWLCASLAIYWIGKLIGSKNATILFFKQKYLKYQTFKMEWNKSIWTHLPGLLEIKI